MDDRDLGSLIDSTQPAVRATDEALGRIQRRARQRQLRARGAVVVVAAAVLLASGATALALGSGPSGHVLPPATQSSAATTTVSAPPSTAATVPPTTPATVPDTTIPEATTTTPSTAANNGDCTQAELTVVIDPNFEGTMGTWHWPVVVTSTSSQPCRLVGLIKAAIHDSNGAIITDIPGNPTTHPASGAGFVSELTPNTPTVIAHLGWSNPCSTGPVQLEVTGFAAPARLDLPQQPCGAGPISTSHFQIERAQ